MVDINLMGDDKEEERGEEKFDEFSNEPGMEAHDFSFEEKTDTFDTSKTVDYSFKSKGYTSNISTLIIIGIIVVLGAAAYYFLFRDKAEETQVQTPAEKFVEPSTSAGQPAEAEKPAETKAQPTTKEAANPPDIKESINPVLSRIIGKSDFAVATTADVMTNMPAGVHISSMSYAGPSLRVEFVAPSESAAQAFSNDLSQSITGGRLTVLSETKLATDGQAWEKVLMAGNVPNLGTASTSGPAKSLSVQETKSWFQSTATSDNLTLKEFQINQSGFSEGFQKTPLYARLSGSRSSVVSFLQSLADAHLNIEINKILVNSMDLVSYDDSNLSLVLFLYHYQEG